MTFYGENIGNTATLMQVEIYCADKGLFIEPQEAYDYWSKKNWLTNKGLPINSLEAAIDAINGIAVQKHQSEIKRTDKPKHVSKKEVKKAARLIGIKNNSEVDYIDYNDQLKDKRWKSFRKFVFEVRGRKCEICGATRDLHVHHLKYRKVRAWEYTVNEVIVVCKSCHKKIHGIK